MSATKMGSKKPPRLGRGLTSLMMGPVKTLPPDSGKLADNFNKDESEPQLSDGTASRPTASADPVDLSYVSIDQIQTNAHQPRRHFTAASMDRLAESIRADGVMQPVIVRPAAEKGSYELVAGERRLRAAQQAGLEKIPAIVRHLDNRQVAEWSLIENLQREDLNPIERAEAFQKLIQDYQLSHEEVAVRVGLDRSSVSNLLRILGLEDSMRQFVVDGLLSLGQARALVGVSDPAVQVALGNRAVADRWSVRQVEAAVRKMGDVILRPEVKDSVKNSSRSALLRDLEKQIGDQLQTKIRIRSGRKKGSGSITIDFYGLDQFDSLLARLGIATE